MELIPGILLGVGLAAAVGFRVFVPFLMMGLANHFGLMQLTEGMQWMGTTPALIAFGTATLFEIGGYFIPWVDNVLDTVTAPAAMLGGTVMMYSTLGEADPLFQYGLSIIAGGGTAGIIKGGAATTRLASTATTGGLGNFMVAGAETTSAVALSLLAPTFTIAIGVLVLLLLTFAVWRIVKWMRRRKQKMSA